MTPFKVGDKVLFKGRRYRVEQAYWSVPKGLGGVIPSLPGRWMYHILESSNPNYGCFAGPHELEPWSALHALAEAAE